MNYQRAFLADIAEHPADATPRRIYADWLEEHGQAERAELIRLQLQRAELPPDDLVGEELLVREQQLLAEHAAAWRATLPCYDGIEWGDFHGGFVEQVIAQTPEAFLVQAEALFQAAPIRRLRLRQQGKRGWGRRLGTDEVTRRLCELNLSNMRLNWVELSDLLHDGWCLEGLEELYLAYVKGFLSSDADGHFLASPHLHQLHTLSVASMSLHRIVPLLMAEQSRTIRHLDMRDICLTGCYPPKGYRLGPTQLVVLQLSNCQLDGETLAAWLQEPNFELLRVLYLNHNPLGDEGIRSLTQQPLRLLRDLDLRHCGLSSRGGEFLLESPLAEQLGRVWLGGNRFDRATWEALRATFGQRLRG
ncbi:MAG: TIGR02996 domain-containing protein [Gemmataceae bacterium]